MPNKPVMPDPLRQLIEELKARKTIGLHVEWGDRPDLTEEQKAELLLTLLEQREKEAATTVAVRISSLHAIYGALKYLQHITKTEVAEIADNSNPDLVLLKMQVRSIVFPALLEADNYLSHEDKKNIRQQLNL